MTKKEIKIGKKAKITGQVILSDEINDSFINATPSENINKIRIKLSELSTELNKISKQISEKQDEQIQIDFDKIKAEMQNEKPNLENIKNKMSQVYKTISSIGAIGSTSLLIINEILKLF